MEGVMKGHEAQLGANPFWVINERAEDQRPCRNQCSQRAHVR